MLTMVNMYTVSDATKHLEYTGSLEYLFLEWEDHGGAEEQTGYTEEDLRKTLFNCNAVVFGGGAMPVFIIEPTGEII